MSEQDSAVGFITEIPSSGLTGVLYRGDADGIASAVIISKALKRLGKRKTVAIPLGRGLNPFSSQTKERLAGYGLSRLIVVDSGSRTGEMLPKVPTLVIDHHRPLGIPQVDVFFNTYGEKPARPTSLVTYDICKGIIDVSDLDWVAAVGVVGDLGPRAPFFIVDESFKKYGRTNIANSVVLINSGHRYRDYRVNLAFDVLSSAEKPEDIAKHRLVGSDELEQMRLEIQDEL